MKNAKKSKKRQKPLYSVEVFRDEENFPILHDNTWGGGSQPSTFKDAKKLYNEMRGWCPTCLYRIISTNGYVRMKSR